MLKKALNTESLIVLLYTLVGMIGALAVMKILAITFTKENFGVYSLILSIVSFISLFPFKCLDQGSTRYVSINRKENSFSEFYSNYIFLFLFATVFYIVVFTIIDFLDIKAGVFTQYIWIIFFFLISEVVKTSLRTVAAADRKRVELFISNSLEFGLKISILFIYSKSITIEKLLVLFIIINVLSSIKLFLENKDSVKLNLINRVNFIFHNKRLWLFAYPFLIMALFTWARDMSNRWILDLYLDKESVALYSVLTTVALIIPMGIQTVIGSYIVPILYQKENIQKGFAREVINLLFMVLPILFIMSALIIYNFSDEIITIFSSSEYIYEKWVLTSLFLAYSLYTLAMFSVYEILANHQPKKLIIPSVISGVLSVVSGFVLIKIYGFDGAIYSYIVGYVTYALLIFTAVIKHRREDV